MKSLILLCRLLALSRKLFTARITCWWMIT